MNVVEIDSDKKGETAQKVIDKLLIGCDQKINRILLSRYDEDDKKYSIVFSGLDFWVYMEAEVDKPITEEEIVQEKERVEANVKEMEQRERERKKNEGLI